MATCSVRDSRLCWRPRTDTMIDKLDIAHLRTLDALHRFATISAAAEHLDVSQQAVCLQLDRVAFMPSRLLPCDGVFEMAHPAVAHVRARGDRRAP